MQTSYNALFAWDFSYDIRRAGLTFGDTHNVKMHWMFSMASEHTSPRGTVLARCPRTPTL